MPSSSPLRFFSRARTPSWRSYASHSKAPSNPQSSPATNQRLTYSKLREIFGPELPGPPTGARLGKELLEALQKQRRTGTLDQQLDIEHATPELLSRGLTYLRASIPLDEDAAIIARFEREESSAVKKAKDWAPQQGSSQTGVYGKPKLDEIRSENEVLNEEYAKEQEARRQKERANTEVIYETDTVWHEGKMQRLVEEIHIKGPEGGRRRHVMKREYIPVDQNVQQHVQQLSAAPAEKGLIKAPNGYAVLQSRDDRDKEKWTHKYKKAAQLSDWDGTGEPPHMPLWRRLGLPALFAVSVLGCCYLLAEVYEPLGPQYRVFQGIPPAAATVYGLIALNVLGFLAWRIPPLWRFMNMNMLMHAVIPRPVQLLGCVFSHQQASHLLWNMLLLWSVGMSLCDEIGRGDFLATYFDAGVFSSLVSLTHLVATKSWHESSLGASGALCGVVFCFLALRAGGYVAFPMPGMDPLPVKADNVMYTLVFLELLGMFRVYVLRRAAKLDHFSHMGGFVAGWVAAQMIKAKAGRQADRRQEVRRKERPSAA